MRERFGGLPSDAKVQQLLDAVVGPASEARAAYFAELGGSTEDGLGAKAAMVGWLLGEAVKADVGSYAHANDAYLNAIALDHAPFGVDILSAYGRPADAYLG